MHGLARSLHTSNNLLDNLALLGIVTLPRDLLKQTAHLSGITAENSSRPAEYRPALLRLERLHCSQLVNHRRRESQNSTTETGINHSLRGQIQHALNLESIGVTQDDAFPQSLALTDSRRTRAFSDLLLLPSQAG
jgi:hypothetical protein